MPQFFFLQKLQNELKLYRKKLSRKNNGVANTSKEPTAAESVKNSIQLQKVSEEKDKVDNSEQDQQPLIKPSDENPVLVPRDNKAELRNPFVRKFATVDRKSFPAAGCSSRPIDRYAWSVAGSTGPGQKIGYATFNDRKHGSGATSSNNDFVRGFTTGDNSSESENIYWSRSEQGEDVGTSKLESGYNALHKRSAGFSAASNAINNYMQNHKPRCRSAMGIFSPQESNYGVFPHYERHGFFNQRFSAEKSGLCEADTSGASTRSIPRPHYHGSVQYLPYQASRDISPPNGPFSIPRPSTITEAVPSYDKVIGPARQENRILQKKTGKQPTSCSSNGTSSVMTKL